MITRILLCPALAGLLLISGGSIAGGEDAVAPAPPPAVSTPPAQAVERLSLDQCIQTALKKNPAIQAAERSAGAAQSKVGQARSGYYPQVSAAGSYTAYSPAADPSNPRLRQYTESATVQQSLFEFGRTWDQVSIQQRNAAAAGEDLRGTRARIVLAVKQAYFGLLRAERNRDVLAETVKQFEQHLNQAKGFFDVGVKSKFDVTKAEVDLSGARLNLIKGENALRIARVTLMNVMGTPDAPPFAIEDMLTYQKSGITFEIARERAFANRPDLRAMEAKREAAETSVRLARKGYLPSLTGSATYSRVDDVNPPEATGWTAGVTITVPLFSGFLTNHQVQEAKETLNAARANEEALKQDALLDVQQAYLNLQEAEERVGLSELTVKQATENYDIARGRYEAGVGSPIEETDALVALSNAKMNHIAALADCKIAEAALLKAMGE